MALTNEGLIKKEDIVIGVKCDKKQKKMMRESGVWDFFLCAILDIEKKPIINRCKYKSKLKIHS